VLDISDFATFFSSF